MLSLPVLGVEPFANLAFASCRVLHRYRFTGLVDLWRERFLSPIVSTLALHLGAPGQQARDALLLAALRLGTRRLLPHWVEVLVGSSAPCGMLRLHDLLRPYIDLWPKRGPRLLNGPLAL